MGVVYISEAVEELTSLPLAERKAMVNALEKLRLFGDQLPFPHSSNVKGTTLRELRPRAGRSPWRALYQRVGDQIVVAAVVPEALHDARGFRRGIDQATKRLRAFEEEQT